MRWSQPFLNDLARRQVVVVLGAGVSKNSISRDGRKRPPLWKEFLELGVAQCGPRGTQHIKSAIKAGDYLHACEWLQKRMDDDWIDFLRGQFLTPGYKESELHDKIFRLDQRVTFSLNIDTIYETFVTSQTSGKTISKQFYDEDVHAFLRDHSDYIIKIHGSIDAPNKIIFSQKDYALARVENSLFYQILDACILSHTILFIGCGVSDPDVNLLLENQNFRFPNSLPHYMITPSKIGSDLEESLRKNRNLKCIKYDDQDNHAELSKLIEELIQKVDSHRTPTTS
ncbi:SIR2-like domain-containing protein [Tistlia consotensis]|uniref:SIR2-like domain-containing protein n=1 Tax=Tistlia consotensis USBA 355 TaxID=560819 RepID=A0A1Y6C9P2_9PROT|nr:SIR2-like domain-containing protein [Tistlia consotensis USBA 355]SNR42951.1 SIR2-like domain-containing protein [Tistlia consotensis]